MMYRVVLSSVDGATIGLVCNRIWDRLPGVGIRIEDKPGSTEIAVILPNEVASMHVNCDAMHRDALTALSAAADELCSMVLKRLHGVLP